MLSVCVVELHVTVNYIKIICIAQQCHYGKFMSPSTFKRSFDVSLTVHLSITLANDQLDAQILTHLLHSSTCTCFEQCLAHPQEVKLY